MKKRYVYGGIIFAELLLAACSKSPDKEQASSREEILSRIANSLYIEESEPQLDMYAVKAQMEAKQNFVSPVNTVSLDNRVRLYESAESYEANINFSPVHIVRGVSR